MSKELVTQLRNLCESLVIVAHTSVDAAKALYPAWIETVLALQEVKGYNKDHRYIRKWHYPHCTCPKMDNDDMFPSEYMHLDTNCPIHGKVQTTE